MVAEANVGFHRTLTVICNDVGGMILGQKLPSIVAAADHLSSHVTRSALGRPYARSRISLAARKRVISGGSDRVEYVFHPMAAAKQCSGAREAADFSSIRRQPR